MSKSEQENSNAFGFWDSDFGFVSDFDIRISDFAMRITRAISGAARAGWSVVAQHRGRSLITLLVSSLGTAGVIVAGSMGEAQVRDIESRLHALGGRLIVVSPNRLPT